MLHASKVASYQLQLRIAQALIKAAGPKNEPKKKAAPAAEKKQE